MLFTGIIRSIDPVSRVFYVIISPYVDQSQLQKVNTFVRGTLPTPTLLSHSLLHSLPQSHVTSAPYTAVDTSTLNTQQQFLRKSRELTEAAGLVTSNGDDVDNGDIGGTGGTGNTGDNGNAGGTDTEVGTSIQTDLQRQLQAQDTWWKQFSKNKELESKRLHSAMLEGGQVNYRKGQKPLQSTNLPRNNNWAAMGSKPPTRTQKRKSFK